MSATLPESVDAWRMVSARRSFSGSFPIKSLARLGEVLAGEEGEVGYELDFGSDEFGNAFLDVRASAPLTLLCQRTLEPFVMPVRVESRLGLIRAEREEAALPPDVEPLLVPEDGRLSPAAVVEDELLLAVPLVPVNPDSSLPPEVTAPGPEDEPATRENPFAILRELKNND